MRKDKLVLLAILIFTLFLFLSGCDSTNQEPNASISESCEEAFEEAASVSQYQDTNEDMNPAFSKCETIREFKKASEKYPDALDGTDPETYIDNGCNFASVELGSTPICKAWEKN